MTPFIVTLTGPSCAGKTTLEKRLKDAGFEQVISTTTRAPRAGEVDGKAYYFIGREEFQTRRNAGEFVESVEFNGNFYAVSADEVRRVAALGKPIVVIVEPEGLKQIRAYCQGRSWNYFTVFIDNPGVVIGERILDRFMADFNAAASQPNCIQKMTEVRNAYAKRLGVMLKEECWWGEDVGPLCDLWLHEFDASNIDGVVNRIASLADECLATN